jgi:hypothetical protein
MISVRRRTGIALIVAVTAVALVIAFFVWEARRSQHPRSTHSTLPHTTTVPDSPHRPPVVFYKSPSLSTIVGHTAIDVADGGRGIPNDETVCFAYGLGQTETAAQYGQVFVGLRDAVSGQDSWYVLTTWDSRGVTREDVHSDRELGGSTSNYVIDSHFGKDTRYSAPADA